MKPKIVIEWTRPKLERLKFAYRQARVLGDIRTIKFDGNKLDIDYAKYLIEYLDERLPK